MRIDAVLVQLPPRDLPTTKGVFRHCHKGLALEILQTLDVPAIGLAEDRAGINRVGSTQAAVLQRQDSACAERPLQVDVHGRVGEDEIHFPPLDRRADLIIPQWPDDKRATGDLPGKVLGRRLPLFQANFHATFGEDPDPYRSGIPVRGAEPHRGKRHDDPHDDGPAWAAGPATAGSRPGRVSGVFCNGPPSQEGRVKEALEARKALAEVHPDESPVGVVL